MPVQLQFIIGVVLIGVVVFSLLSGKIIAGSRGLSANYYYRKDNPVLFYFFVVVYASISAFIFAHL